MYPVSGGTARFPHFAFGSVAGIGFGFFSYVQAVTIAPIECFAFMQYAAVLLASIYDSTTENVTGVGFIADRRPDGDLRRGQLPGHAHLRPGQQRHHVVEGRDPGPDHHRAAVPLAHRQLHRRRPGLHAGRDPRPCSRALPAAGIIFAYSGFEQCDQLAGEIKNPGRNLPRAIIISVLIGTAIYCLLQVVFIGAMPPGELIGHGFAAITNKEILAGPFAGLAGARRARLAGAPPADRRLRLPVRHRPDLHDRDLAGQLRPGQEPVLPADLRQGRHATASRGSG